MKTLFVSDLDGTLLRSDKTASPYTKETLNRLLGEGMLFAYATARSLVTARNVTRGIDAPFPAIVYNGAFIMDNATGKILHAQYFDGQIRNLILELVRADIYPLVYAYVDGVECFSYFPKKGSKGLQEFIADRPTDPRNHPVETMEEYLAGEIFYLVCIDSPEKLLPFFERYKDRYIAYYQKDLYSDEQWLEFLPKGATKANAARILKEEYYHCDHMVAFGDGINDIDLFEIADEGYAVANAVDGLKKAAAGIIGDHDEDGVARWLDEQWTHQKKGMKK